MIPTKIEEKAFDEYVGNYLVEAPPIYEVCISGVLTKRSDNILCSMGVFKGLFEEKGLDQIMVQDQRRECSLDDKGVHLFADHVIESLYAFHALDKNVDTVRLAVDKHFNPKPTYKKYLDIHINKIRGDRDKTILHNIIYFLLRYSAAGKYIIQSKRRQEDASTIWTLFPEQIRSCSLPSPVQGEIQG